MKRTKNTIDANIFSNGYSRIRIKCKYSKCFYINNFEICKTSQYFAESFKSPKILVLKHFITLKHLFLGALV